MLSKQEIAGLRELLAKATPGPWQSKNEYEWDEIIGNIDGPDAGQFHYTHICSTDMHDLRTPEQHANAAIIAAAVNALPALLDIAEAVANAQTGKVESIDMCTDRPTWHVMDDRGMVTIEIGGKRVALVVLPLAGEVANG